MATTKLFYQTPIGGVSMFNKAMNACVTYEDTMIPIEIDVCNAMNGYAWLYTDDISSGEELKYLKFTDISQVWFKVQLDLIDTLNNNSPVYLLEGMTVKPRYTYYNPFNYKLSVGNLDLHMYYTSQDLTPKKTLPTNSNVPANSATTTTTMSSNFKIPSPDVVYPDLYSIPAWAFNLSRVEDSRLHTSGNTDISGNVVATPVPYFSTSGCMAKEVVCRPYVVLRRNGSGNVNSGTTVTLYADVYNKNPKSFTNLKVALSLSGSGFSGGSGTLSTTTLTGITVGSTASQANINKTTVSFTYTAPSSTSQGTATITPQIKEFSYNGSSMSNIARYWPGTGSTVSITVNAAAPATRYLPFYMKCEGVYLTANDFSTYFGDNMYLNVGPCTDGNHMEGVPNTMSDGSGHTIFYFSTTTFSSITMDKACAMLVSTTGDYEFSSEAHEENYTLPTSATLSAFRSAGIFTLEGYNVAPAVGCGAGAIIKLDQNQYGTIFFSAYPEESVAIPLDTSGRLQHLYLRLQLHYQNSSYASGFSRDRTLIYDLASRISSDGGSSYVSGTIGNIYDESMYSNCATNVYAVSDTWGNSQITVMDLAAQGGSSSYGGAYISGIHLSTSTSGPWSDLSIDGSPYTFYNRTWILGDIDATLQTYLMSDEQTSPYTYYWCSMVATLQNPCAQGGIIADDQMHCNSCDNYFCATQGCCPYCGECNNIYPTGNSC